MREIRFRAIAKETKEWVQGENILFVYTQCGEKVCSIQPSGSEQFYVGNGYYLSQPVEVDTETVGEYSGYKDRHKIKLFEGDIFTHADAPKDARFVLVFKNGEFYGESYDCGVYYFSEATKEEDIEIVGNIHDDKGLMGTRALQDFAESLKQAEELANFVLKRMVSEVPESMPFSADELAYSVVVSIAQGEIWATLHTGEDEERYYSFPLSILTKEGYDAYVCNMQEEE